MKNRSGKFLLYLILMLTVSVGVSAAEKSPAISILGDSYSTFAGYIPKGYAVWYSSKPNKSNDLTKVEQTWWHRLITMLNGKLEKNDSWSGSTICNTGYGRADYSDRSFVNRSGRLGNPDIILVCGGTNDCWAKSPIGEYKYSDWSREDLYSFRPAMAKLCHDLLKNYPRAKIYFILNSELSPEINDSVHEICRHYRISCIDLQNIEKKSDHPSVAGMEAFASQVAEVLKKDLK